MKSAAPAFRLLALLGGCLCTPQVRVWGLPSGFPPDLPPAVQTFLQRTTNKNAGEQCYWGQAEILLKLDLLRRHTDLLDGWEHAPIEIPDEHQGVALHRSDQAWQDGVEIDYTNWYRTGWLGFYRSTDLKGGGRWTQLPGKYKDRDYWDGEYPDDPLTAPYSYLNDDEKAIIDNQFREVMKESGIEIPEHLEDKPDDNVDVARRSAHPGEPLLHAYLRLAVTRGEAWAEDFARDLNTMSANESASLGQWWTPESWKIVQDLNRAQQKFIAQMTPGEETNAFLRHLQEEQTLADSIQALPAIAILRNGYHRTLSDLMATFAEPSAWIDPSFDAHSLVTRQPVLVIGSGGLFGLDASRVFRTALEAYVASGGTLIVFAQQHGYDFAPLPGGEVSGFGWAEDQSCQFQSATIVQYAPYFAGMTSNQPDLNVDGYFTRWPDHSTILLRRAANDQPCMVEYTHGAGRVIATTLYSDQAYGLNQLSLDEQRFLRDLLAWAKDPEALDQGEQTAPGETVDLAVNVVNVTAADVHEVVVRVIDPNGVPVEEIPVDVMMPPNHSATLPVSYALPEDAAGIYTLDYSLKQADGTVIGNAFDVHRFACGVFQADPDGLTVSGQGMEFSVQSSSEAVLRGSTVLFTIKLWNRGPATRRVRLRYHMPHNANWQCGEYWPESCPPYVGDREVEIPAQGEQDVILALAIWNTDHQDTLWVEFTDADTGEHLGVRLKSIQVNEPYLEVVANLDEEEVGPGSLVQGDVQLRNEDDQPLTADLTIRARGPANELLWQRAEVLTAPAEGSTGLDFAFPVPETTTPGVCLVTAEATKDGRIVGMNSTLFRVPDQVLIHVDFNHADAVYRVGDLIEFDVVLQSTVPESQSGTVEISVPMHDSITAHAFDLPGHAEVVVQQQFYVSHAAREPDPALDTPDGSLDITATTIYSGAADLGFEMWLREPVPAEPSGYVAYVWMIDTNEDGQHEYMARVSYDPDPTHGPYHGWKGYIDPLQPELERHELLDSFLIDGSYVGLHVPSSWLRNPAALAWSCNAIPGTDRAPDQGAYRLAKTAGAHQIQVSLDPQPIAKDFPFFIRYPELSWRGPTVTDCAAGDQIDLSLVNDGGESSAARCQATWVDWLGGNVVSTTATAPVAPETFFALDVRCPDQLVSGHYRLIASAVDEAYGVGAFATEPLHVTGIGASISIGEMEDTYPMGAPILPTLSLSRLGAIDISDARLRVGLADHQASTPAVTFEARAFYDPDAPKRVPEASVRLAIDAQGTVHAIWLRNLSQAMNPLFHARLPAAANEWQAPVEVGVGHPQFDLDLYTDSTGRIYLLNNQALRISDDGGGSWSSERSIPYAHLAIGSSDRLLAGGPESSTSMARLSNDNGVTWSEPIEVGPGALQGLIADGNGRWAALLRQYRSHAYDLYVCTSMNGVDWSAPVLAAEDIAVASTLALCSNGDGDLVVTVAEVAEVLGLGWKAVDLSVVVSRDRGQSWSDRIYIDTGGHDLSPRLVHTAGIFEAHVESAIDGDEAVHVLVAAGEGTFVFQSSDLLEKQDRTAMWANTRFCAGAGYLAGPEPAAITLDPDGNACTLFVDNTASPDFADRGVLFSRRVSGQDTWSESRKVSEDAIDYEVVSPSAILLDDQGMLHAFEVQTRESPSQIVHASSADQGVTWSGWSDCIPLGAEVYPSTLRALIDANGVMYVAWDDPGNTTDAAGTVIDGGLYIASSPDRGASWSAPATITEPYAAGRDGREPDLELGAGAGGVLYAAWANTLDHNAPAYWDICVSRGMNQGSIWTPCVAVLTDVPQDTPTEPLSLCVDPMGTLYLACITSPESDHPDQMLFMQSTDGGAAWSEPVVLSQFTADAVRAPFLTCAPNGDLYALCFQRNDAASQVVMAYSQDGGASWSTPVTVVPDAPGEWGFPALAFGPADQALLICSAYDEYGSGRLLYARSEDRGATWLAPDPVGISLVYLRQEILPATDAFHCYVASGYGLAVASWDPTIFAWSTSLPIQLGAEALEVPLTISGPSAVGRYTLEASLISVLGQEIAGVSQPLTVFSQGYYMTLTPDQTVYRPGQPVHIAVELVNATGEGRAFDAELKSGEATIWAQPTTLGPGDRRTFSVEMSAAATVQLEGRMDDFVAVETVRVVEPSVRAAVYAPTVVGRNQTYDVEVAMVNDGNHAVDLDVGAVQQSGGGDAIPHGEWTVSLAPGESWSESWSVTLGNEAGATTAWRLHVSGDVIDAAEAVVRFGERVLAAVDPEPVYLTPTVVLPLRFSNQGVLDSRFDAMLSVDGQQATTHAMFVPRGQTVEQSATLTLGDGEHVVTCTTPFERIDAVVRVNVPRPSFTVTPNFTSLQLSAGQPGSLSFHVTNVGAAEGFAAIPVRIPGLVDDVVRVLLGPGEAQDVSMTFSTPSDLDSRTDRFTWSFQGETAEVPMEITGLQIDVEAQLDKAFYELGDTIHLDVTVHNHSLGTLDGELRVQLSDHGETLPITVVAGGSVSESFEMPAILDGSKLSFGLYHASGRSLYLNAYYVRASHHLVRICPDQQQHDLGDAAQLVIETDVAGTLTLQPPPGWTAMEAGPFGLGIGAHTLDFAIPDEEKQGTHRIGYRFLCDAGEVVGEVPIDVAGCQIKIMKTAVEDVELGVSDTVRAYVNIECTRGVESVVRCQVLDPERRKVHELEQAHRLEPGSSQLLVEVPFSTQMGGLYTLVYAFYVDLAGHSYVLMASGAQYFDVLDTHSPSVVSVNVASMAPHVPVASIAHILFDEHMDQPSVEDAVSVSPPIPMSLTWIDSSCLVITPEDRLPYNTPFTLTIGNTAVDLAGNPLAQTYQLAMKTAPHPSTRPPTLDSATVSPARGFSAIVRVLPGCFYIVQGSSDLLTWEVRSRFTATHDPVAVSDTGDDSTLHFYRVIAPVP